MGLHALKANSASSLSEDDEDVLQELEAVGRASGAETLAARPLSTTNSSPQDKPQVTQQVTAPAPVQIAERVASPAPGALASKHPESPAAAADDLASWDMSPILAKTYNAARESGLDEEKSKNLARSMWDAIVKLMKWISRLLGRIFHAPSGSQLTDDQAKGDAATKTKIEDTTGGSPGISDANVKKFLNKSANQMVDSTLGAKQEAQDSVEPQNSDPIMGVVPGDEDSLESAAPEEEQTSSKISKYRTAGMVHPDLEVREVCFHLVMGDQVKDLLAGVRELHQRKELREAMAAELAQKIGADPQMIIQREGDANFISAIDTDGRYDAIAKSVQQKTGELALLKYTMQQMLEMPQSHEIRKSNPESVLNQWEELLRSSLDNPIEDAIPTMEEERVQRAMALLESQAPDVAAQESADTVSDSERSSSRDRAH
jgi:hypothetical protein